MRSLFKHVGTSFATTALVSASILLAPTSIAKPFLGLIGNGDNAPVDCEAGSEVCNGGNGGLFWGNGGNGANGGNGGRAWLIGNGGNGGDRYSTRVGAEPEVVLSQGGNGGDAGIIGGNGGNGGLSGGNGGNAGLLWGDGGKGQDGEDAVYYTVGGSYAFSYTSAILGGNGGNGGLLFGNGGNGGNGGSDINTVRPKSTNAWGRNGGNGGRAGLIAGTAGNGGNGGNAGINIYGGTATPGTGGAGGSGGIFGKPGTTGNNGVDVTPPTSARIAATKGSIAPANTVRLMRMSHKERISGGR